jgi:tetratricopeptide (TPR) repeat protein
MIGSRLPARTTRAARLAAAGVAALLLVALPARADDVTSARDHFKRGQTHYGLGEFEQAAAEFREAYRLRDEPAILFNIAQSFRRAGNAREAYSYYSKFLERKPAASNRADVERFIEQMRRKVDAEEAAGRARPPAGGAHPVGAEAPHDGAPAAIVSGGNSPVPAQGASAAPASTALPVPAATPGTADAPSPAATASPVRVEEGAAGPAASRQADIAQPASAAPAAAPTTPTAAPADALRASAAPKAARAKTLRYAGLATVGVGIGAEVLAFIFHASAQSSANELSRRYQAGTLQASDASLRRDMDSKGRLSTVAAIGGAVLIAAGTAAVFTF